MGDRYIYGELEGALIFLREETVVSLTRLWSSIASVESWSEIRKRVGDELTDVVMRMADVGSVIGSDEPAFNRDDVGRRVAACWTPRNLMQLMTIDLPFSAWGAGEMRWCRVNRCGYLMIPPSGESYAVLALVSEGCWPDRDDAAIRWCIPEPDGPSKLGDVPVDSVLAH